MSRAGGSRYVPGYDLFKLIVSVILTILLIALLLREQNQRMIIPTATIALPAPPVTVTSSQTSVSPTVSPSPTSPPPAATEAPPPEQPTPAPTAPPPTAQPTFESASETCPSAPSRIQVGDDVRVLHWLYFRKGPGLNWPILLTNGPGTEMKVVGGPVTTCRDSVIGRRGYIWWNLQMRDGREGWSAEAPLIESKYFLEPIR